MSFSRKQQGPYREMVELAWQAQAPQLGCRLDDREGKRLWYEEQLLLACEVRSTRDCDALRDYEAAMAHFEGLVGNGSFFWGLKRVKGDANRVLHEVQRVAANFDCSEEYMLAIAQRALRTEVLPAWPELDARSLLLILSALKQQARRQLTRGQTAAGPRREDRPF